MSTKKKPPMPDTAELSKTATAGKISDAVNGKLAAMRHRTAELLAEVGRLEVRKAAVLQEIRQLDTEASGMLNTEAKRLGIPEGRTWRIEPDGTATVL